MKTLQVCTPRPAVLDGTADFVVNLADLPRLTEAQAREFLDSNVLTSGMELLLMQAFSRLAGVGSPSGIYKLSDSMGGGKTQSMIVAGILARFPHLASLLPFQKPLPAARPDLVASFTGRPTDKKVWVTLGQALGGRLFPRQSPLRGGVAGRAQGPLCPGPPGRAGLLPGPCGEPGDPVGGYPGGNPGEHCPDEPVRGGEGLQGVPAQRHRDRRPAEGLGAGG